MIKEIIAFKLYNLMIFSILVYFASFAIPTGALFLILSFSSITVTITERTILILIIIISTILGDISTYWFARLLSNKLNKFFTINDWFKKQENIAHKFINKYGFYAVFLSRFVFSGLGPIINYYCGLKKYNFKQYALAVIFGEIIYATIYSIIGIVFKNFISEILNLLNGLFILMILGIGIYMTIKQIKKEIRKTK